MMNEEVTERKYLLTTQKCTWEDVHLFEDSFGPLTFNDNCMKDKDKWENHFSSDTTAKEENIVPSHMDSGSDEFVLKNTPHDNIDKEHQDKTEIYIKPTIVCGVRVLLASIEDVVKSNSNVHQVFFQPLTKFQT